jgi:hypothetical protein
MNGKVACLRVGRELRLQATHRVASADVRRRMSACAELWNTVFLFNRQVLTRVTYISQIVFVTFVTEVLISLIKLLISEIQFLISRIKFLIS